MPRPRIAMRKIREALRLGLGEGFSPRQVAASLMLPRIAVRRYLERAYQAGVSWPLPEGWTTSSWSVGCMRRLRRRA